MILHATAIPIASGRTIEFEPIPQLRPLNYLILELRPVSPCLRRTRNSRPLQQALPLSFLIANSRDAPPNPGVIVVCKRRPAHPQSTYCGARSLYLSFVVHSLHSPFPVPSLRTCDLRGFRLGTRPVAGVLFVLVLSHTKSVNFGGVRERLFTVRPIAKYLVVFIVTRPTSVTIRSFLVVITLPLIFVTGTISSPLRPPALAFLFLPFFFRFEVPARIVVARPVLRANVERVHHLSLRVDIRPAVVLKLITRSCSVTFVAVRPGRFALRLRGRRARPRVWGTATSARARVRAAGRARRGCVSPTTAVRAV